MRKFSVIYDKKINFKYTCTDLIKIHLKTIMGNYYWIIITLKMSWYYEATMIPLSFSGYSSTSEENINSSLRSMSGL